MTEPTSPTILIVDDDAVTLKTAALFLRSAGYTVSTAGSGEEALALIRSSPGVIPLLLTDVIMPGLTGPELAAEALRLHKAVRVLLMSAGTPDQLEEYWAVGSGYPILPKPLSSASLVAAVRRILA
jgi:CheY-like chemotaxis protein